MNILLYLICFEIFMKASIFGQNETSTINGNSTNATTERYEIMRAVSRILLEGAEDEVDDVPLSDLIYGLDVLRNVDVTVTSVTKIWNKMKTEEGLDKINLRTMRGYFEFIPHEDLTYLAKFKTLQLTSAIAHTRLERQIASIISSALVAIKGEKYFMDHKNINTLQGIICGMPYQILHDIADKEFVQISGEVFEDLQACSLRRVRWFLLKMMKPTAYGPPQVWDSNVMHQLNMLLLALLPEELIAIRPEMMSSLEDGIIKLMDMRLIKSFTKAQIANFNARAFYAYKRKLFLTSEQVIHRSNLSFRVLMFILLLTF